MYFTDILQMVYFYMFLNNEKWKLSIRFSCKEIISDLARIFLILEHKAQLTWLQSDRQVNVQLFWSFTVERNKKTESKGSLLLLLRETVEHF